MDTNVFGQTQGLTHSNIQFMSFPFLFVCLLHLTMRSVNYYNRMLIKEFQSWFHLIKFARVSVTILSHPSQPFWIQILPILNLKVAPCTYIQERQEFLWPLSSPGLHYNTNHVSGICLNYPTALIHFDFKQSTNSQEAWPSLAMPSNTIQKSTCILLGFFFIVISYFQPQCAFSTGIMVK